MTSDHNSASSLDRVTATPAALALIDELREVLGLPNPKEANHG